MRKYLDNLGLSDVSRLSGAKPTTIKLWLHRKQLDAPPIFDKNRIFAAEHVLQVILMKLLTDRGIPARKAGPKARQLEPEVLRRLEAGESPDVSDLPIQTVLGTYLKGRQRYEAKRKAAEAAREAEEARRAGDREREQQQWDTTWGGKEWIWEQQRKAEQTGDWQLWHRCEQALNDRWVGQVRSIPEPKRGRGRPIGSYGIKTW